KRLPATEGRDSATAAKRHARASGGAQHAVGLDAGIGSNRITFAGAPTGERGETAPVRPQPERRAKTMAQENSSLRERRRAPADQFVAPMPATQEINQGQFQRLIGDQAIERRAQFLADDFRVAAVAGQPALILRA